jgi:hypothetical protein
VVELIDRSGIVIVMTRAKAKEADILEGTTLRRWGELQCVRDSRFPFPGVQTDGIQTARVFLLAFA